MEDIKHTYTIQWVGPLTYDEYKEYVKGTDTIASGYFNFYYFEARKVSPEVTIYGSSDISSDASGLVRFCRHKCPPRYPKADIWFL